jgi:hypothetical protein
MLISGGSPSHPIGENSGVMPVRTGYVVTAPSQAAAGAEAAPPPVAAISPSTSR